MADDVAVRELFDDARALAASGEWAKLVALVTSLHPADLAELVLELPEEERVALLDHLPTDVVAELFEYVEDDDLRELIKSVGVKDLPAVLEEAEDDVAADVIQQLEPEEQAETLAQMDRGEEVAELLQYGDESAGGIMSRGFVALNENISVQQAIDYLRVLRPPSERAYYLYVVDNDRVLQGVVSIRDLLVSSPKTLLKEITQRDVHAVTTDADQEEAARILQKYNLLAVPVVDAEGRLEGVMTADDLIDVLQEEATEDMYRMVGLDEAETVLSPVWRSVRRRVPWLLVNLATAFLAALVVRPFEDTISRAAALAVFMPVIAGHAGNTGTQAVTLVVRGMALGDVKVSDWLLVLRKELAFGLIHGVLAGSLTAGMALLLSMNPWLGAVVFTALMANVMIGGIMGAIIPLTIKRLGGDPAVASSIWLTTFTDVMGFLMLLGLGTILINRLS
ncbi:magnesium transporter [Tepidiforma sp.]|uniref:magnesium transporter n=1 Tax=Tepidiforma sp. TaxID=2682230 RepID=UPI0021DDCFE7|nr:magnesium transporter [Tepidiforma sp.]MCX7616721.1 magnesium transporter [Tepidiforma sp.]GIW19552.1 MAG: magnesium transporter MgtE [Tepidiforma sp.]